MMGKKGKGTANAGKKRPDDELVDLIFSWSLQDVMNQDLFRDKVRRSLSSLHLLARWSIAVLVALHRKLFFFFTSLSPSGYCTLCEKLVSD